MDMEAYAFASVELSNSSQLACGENIFSVLLRNLGNNTGIQGYCKK